VLAQGGQTASTLTGTVKNKVSGFDEPDILFREILHHQLGGWKVDHLIAENFKSLLVTRDRLDVLGD